MPWCTRVGSPDRNPSAPPGVSSGRYGAARRAVGRDQEATYPDVNTQAALMGSDEKPVPITAVVPALLSETEPPNPFP
jgi:hypothetical protein